MTLIETVRRFFDEAGLAGSSGVVAVSGGPDSVALAHILVQLQREGFLDDVVLAHLNHQLRAAESDADEAFVAALPATWQIGDSSPPRCRTTRLDVARISRQRGENLEKTARELRYEWLAAVAHEEGAAWLATGHSADDQAETVLHRLLRGTGLQGLTAMAPRRILSIHGPELVRPLLQLRREQILAYLQQHDLPSRQDSTNADLKLTRNRLRLQLLPLLAEHFQPAIVDILCRLADQAQVVQAEVHVLAENLLRQAELPRAGPLLVFAADVLRSASAHLVCEVFRLVWQRENWPMNAMDRPSWLRLDDLVRGRQTHHDFPGAIHARRRDNVLQVGLASRAP